LLAAQTTTQGTILVTGDKKLTVYGKPSHALNNVIFDNVNVSVSIPDQGTSNPTVSITTNHLPSLNWIVPGTNPQVVDGRAYYTFIGNDNNSNATVSWAANADNPIVELTFVGGTGSPIVRLDDLSPGGGPSAQSYWYVQIIQAVTGDITNYDEMFYGAGAVNNGGAGPSYVPAQAPIQLPVELLGFRAEAMGREDGLLKWETASEHSASHFEIERRAENEEGWGLVGEVEAVGNLDKWQSYSYLDWGVGQSGGRFYYRLKIVDEDGSMAYSPIREIRFDAMEAMTLFPNPASTWVRVQFGEGQFGLLQLFAADGTLAAEAPAFESGNRLALPSELPPGAYLLRVVKENGQFFQQKMMIGKG
jgi:hypothetical protein